MILSISTFLQKNDRRKLLIANASTLINIRQKLFIDLQEQAESFSAWKQEQTQNRSLSVKLKRGAEDDI